MVGIDEPLKLEKRTIVGKGLAGLRHGGLVPAVLHDHGRPSMHLVVPYPALDKVYRAAGKHHPLQLVVGSQNFLALIKDVQVNPVKRSMQHVVFQAIKQDETVEAEVPIRLDGDSPAERTGLIVLHQLDSVQVQALPKDLPDELVADASRLVELHDKLTVADLTVPAGVTIVTEPEHPIATVAEPRSLAAEEAEEAEGEEAEGEAAAEGEEAGVKSGKQADEEE